MKSSYIPASGRLSVGLPQSPVKHIIGRSSRAAPGRLKAYCAPKAVGQQQDPLMSF
jgi:hypothetical protein